VGCILAGRLSCKKAVIALTGSNFKAQYKCVLLKLP